MEKERHYFEYGEKEIRHLKNCDRVFKEAIEKIGIIHREVIPDLFRALVNAIIGQQISAKAHKTVWNRLVILVDPLTPENVLSVSTEQIKECGMTYKKGEYIQDLSRKIISGEFDLVKVNSLSDEETIKYLTTLKGVGKWTAEMLLIFSLQRPNIFSYDDLAIVRGLKILYKHKTMSKKRFESYRKKFHPYQSVASLYLWEIAGNQSDN